MPCFGAESGILYILYACICFPYINTQRLSTSPFRDTHFPPPPHSMILISLLVILQWKSRGWVINIYFIIICVRFKSKSYIFYYYILNVWVLFWSTECQLMEHLRPNMGNPLVIFFVLFLFLLVLCVPVHDNHKHVQGWNPTTTTYFPGINNNNNKHRDKPNNKLRGKGFDGYIPILNMFMVLMNRMIWKLV